MMLRSYRFVKTVSRGTTIRRQGLSSSVPPPPPKGPKPNEVPSSASSSPSSSSSPTPPPSPHPTELKGAAAAQTHGVGTGKGVPVGVGSYIKDRGPVSWPSFFLVGIAAASIVAYYNIERERRLETAMGRVVSSESPDGWSPNPDLMAPRKFKLTPWGWFPEDDGFGPCKFVDVNWGALEGGGGSGRQPFMGEYQST